MTECDEYVKAYSDLKAFILLACRASERSEKLALDLLHRCCRSAVDYGRTTYNVQQDIIEASVPIDEKSITK